MKKISYLFLAALIAITGFASCKKIVDAIFTGVDVKSPDLAMTVPAIPFVIPMELGFGSFTQSFNLDSAVKANTAGAFGADAVHSVKIKSVTITITNADDNNNLSNFESARVMLSSNAQADPVELFSQKFPTTNTSTYTITPADSPELVPHLKNGELTYHMFG